MRPFERFKLPHGFQLATFSEGGFDGVFQCPDVHRLGQAVMSAARSLQRFELLMDLEGAGDNDNWNMRQQFLQLGKELKSQLTFVEHMIQNEQVGWRLG